MYQEEESGDRRQETGEKNVPGKRSVFITLLSGHDIAVEAKIRTFLHPESL